MSRDLNKVMLIGRLAVDPELRATVSGQTVVNFRVATNRQWNDAQGQPQSQTEFTAIVAWGRLADLANQYLRKGRQVYIEGRLQTRSWVDKANVKHWRTEVVAESLIFLGAPAGAPTDLPVDLPVEASAKVGVPVKVEASTRAGAGEPVPPPPPPEPGTPASPKAPVSAKATADRPAEVTVKEEQLEEIRIEDIPF